MIVALLGPALTRAADRRRCGSSWARCCSIFGLQWLRKAILRASGYKALHDEDAIFRQEVAEARAAGALERERVDWYSFTVAFKGVFLEGLEVAFIVRRLRQRAPSRDRAGLAGRGRGLLVVVRGRPWSVLPSAACPRTR